MQSPRGEKPVPYLPSASKKTQQTITGYGYNIYKVYQGTDVSICGEVLKPLLSIFAH